MLNGIDPIIIFSFFKNKPSAASGLAKIPIVGATLDQLKLPPIPLYLSETLTGLYIDTEEKNLDIETNVNTLSSGEPPIFTQKGIDSIVTVNLIGKRNSTGLTLFLALCDIIFAKVNSQEYSVSYLHGAITIFDGLLHSFSVSNDSNTDLYKIKIEFSRGNVVKQPQVPPTDSTQTAQLNDGGNVTGGGLPPAASQSAGGATTGGTFKSVPIGGLR